MARVMARFWQCKIGSAFSEWSTLPLTVSFFSDLSATKGERSSARTGARCAEPALAAEPNAATMLAALCAAPTTVAAAWCIQEEAGVLAACATTLGVVAGSGAPGAAGAPKMGRCVPGHRLTTLGTDGGAKSFGCVGRIDRTLSALSRRSSARLERWLREASLRACTFCRISSTVHGGNGTWRTGAGRRARAMEVSEQVWGDACAQAA